MESSTSENRITLESCRHHRMCGVAAARGAFGGWPQPWQAPPAQHTWGNLGSWAGIHWGLCWRHQNRTGAQGWTGACSHSSAICCFCCSSKAFRHSSHTFLFKSECGLLGFLIIFVPLKGKLNCKQEKERSGWKNTPRPGVVRIVVNIWIWFCHFLSVLLVNSPAGLAGCAPCCFHRGSLRNCSWNAGISVPKNKWMIL